ncbi:hypothetical protein ABZY90_24120 [Streptomyces sp. NPDC006422]|uniref:hypothetical protein n=1 Tax=unclassified Streptomyces TaxID=2593676 RepID=UPI0033A3F73F
MPSTPATGAHALPVFEPTRPASRTRRLVAFGLGALLWVGSGLLGVALLGHTGILVRLLFVTVISCAFFSLALVWAITLRGREERRERP